MRTSCIVVAALASAMLAHHARCKNHTRTLWFKPSFQNQTKKLSFQNTRLPVSAQLNPIVGGENPSVLSHALPIAGEEPVACFARMALASPGDEPLLQQVIVSAHG